MAGSSYPPRIALVHRSVGEVWESRRLAPRLRSSRLVSHPHSEGIQMSAEALDSQNPSPGSTAMNDLTPKRTHGGSTKSRDTAAAATPLPDVTPSTPDPRRWWALAIIAVAQFVVIRSEERRVGKECSSRWL